MTARAYNRLSEQYREMTQQISGGDSADADAVARVAIDAECAAYVEGLELALELAKTVLSNGSNEGVHVNDPASVAIALTHIGKALEAGA